MKPVCRGLITLILVAVMCAQNPQTDSGIQSTVHQPQQAAAPLKVEKGNAAQLQHDADELVALTRSIPADIDAANRGLLPKDMVEKLKRIEKLSKQLRKELPRQL